MAHYLSYITGEYGLADNNWNTSLIAAFFCLASMVLLYRDTSSVGTYARASVATKPLLVHLLIVASRGRWHHSHPVGRNPRGHSGYLVFRCAILRAVQLRFNSNQCLRGADCQLVRGSLNRCCMQGTTFYWGFLAAARFGVYDFAGCVCTQHAASSALNCCCPTGTITAAIPGS